jgi:hypothetical protein
MYIHPFVDDRIQSDSINHLAIVAQETGEFLRKHGRSAPVTAPVQLAKLMLALGPLLGPR